MQPMYPEIKGMCSECGFPVFSGADHKHNEGMEDFIQRVVSSRQEEFFREEILPKDGNPSEDKIF